MSLHKLTAGDGYTYLTRQVAAQDATHRGYHGLGDYYAQRGESPGVWLGRGADGLPGFPAGPQVLEEQMVALFGEGRHPDAAAIEAEMVASGHDVPAILAATRLGSPYRVASGVPEFRKQLAVRFEAWNDAAGLPRDWPVPEAERARIRTELGRELFTTKYGRPPLDSRELAGFLARASRQQTTAVAGYDLTFTPVKSVSAYWAVAPHADARAVEQAHAQVVEETLTWLEEHAAYSRLGRNGVRQVPVRGLIAAAFTHRDSRAGDPNLHTHVAISNKVQVAEGLQAGQWVALDGRPLHKLAVAASERYNTRLEALLTERLGLRFAERPSTEPGKRAVREVIGVDERLTSSWSARRAAIDVRRAELSTRFHAEHGRPPGPIEAVKLAQRATLETRQAKHEPRTHPEQRALWRAQALAVLGGPHGLQAMLHTTRRRPRRTGRRAQRRRGQVSPAWVAGTAQTVLATVQAGRATWQEAHVRAEAERRVRAASLTLGQVDAAVERVVAAALSPERSLALGVVEPVSEPVALRRTDGSSMYASAGMQLFTSPTVVAAERTLIATARRTDGRTASSAAVDLAIAESAARGVPLNPGQAALVRELATSGSRLQLALAPAGTGKTTAMRVLARAWTGDGGTVIGLAPSAAAAAVLGGELHAPTDTLAKLLHSLDQLEQDGRGTGHRTGQLPGWLQQIGPNSLVVIDEAGMAGTPELARAVAFVVARGGSIRLVGDDQQLAAISAGGVLRDLADTSGAVTLSQVVRFTDPAEGAASLALRAGEAAAIGFYIDHSRVHVGDAGTVVDQAYAAWSDDRAGGLDALMLAPTRQVAAALNARARADRLAAAGPQASPGDANDATEAAREVQLADGSAASAGDTIVTRRNDRRLALSATDWVKNGDRWRVDQVLEGGALQVTHLASRRPMTLPAAYTGEHVALGYASTIHAAQGTTADVCHTVASGAESRQLLYVAMTRGRAANHLYLTSVGDGDEHSVITPDALLPPTAVDLLGRILARDGAQTSATTAQRTLADPAVRLAAAAGRYDDSLTVAAQTHLGPERMAQIDAAAEGALTGLTSSPAWPTLRAHLALLEVDGTPAGAALVAAIGRRETDTALDPAAVLDWRLDRTGGHSAGSSTGRTGPLPWLPAVPAALAANPTWGDYLAARDRHTRDLAGQVAERARGWTPTSAPAWAQPLVSSADSTAAAGSVTPGRDRAQAELLVWLAVWRAAHGVDETDLRPTGPPQLAAADLRAQKQLDAEVRRALGDPASTSNRWKALAEQIEPRIVRDPFWPQLADRLAAADRAGIDIAALARTAGAQGLLPDELPAAALWWRLSRHLSPAALQAHHSDAVGTASTLRPPWTPALTHLIGPDAARRVLADPAWPALVAAVSDATGNGWTPVQVLTTAYELLGDPNERDAGAALRPGELATALVWRIGMLADPEPFDPDLARGWGTGGDSTLSIPPDPVELDLQPPGDLHDDPTPGAPAGVDVVASHDGHVDAPPLPEWGEGGAASAHETPSAVGDAAAAPAQPRAPLAAAAAGSGVSQDRLLELNGQAARFFAAGYPGSWAVGHLRERLGTDLSDDPRFPAGYAPASWTALTDHLRSLGASDHELLAAGLASQARTGRLIDRFRDRLILPIQTTGTDVGEVKVVGFIDRRNPDTPDAGPKYLNTGQTALFSKGAQLYGMAEAAAELAAGATPVLVEGPLDAIAVTLAAEGAAVGVAPLGTAFTDAQADTLRPYLGPGRPGVVVASDADEPGRNAAVRAYWQLTARGGNPTHLVMPDGHDPASLLHNAGPAALRQALIDPPTLARTLIDARVGQFGDRMHHAEGPVLAVRSAAEAIGALPPEHWLDHIDYLNSLVQTTPGESHLAVLDAGHAWIADPDGRTRKHLADRIHTRPQTPDTHQAVADPGPAAPAAEGGPEAPRIGTVHRDAMASSPAEAGREPGSPVPASERNGDLAEQWAADVWVDVGRSIDPALVAGADWSGLAAALDRASRAGYDVQQHLPRLATRSPLPEVRPARALHYRLVDECAAAITPLPPLVRHAGDEQRAAAALARLKTEADLHDGQLAAVAHPAQSPVTGALDAAQDRMRTEGRRLDNEQARSAPANTRTPTESGHDPTPARHRRRQACQPHRSARTTAVTGTCQAGGVTEPRP